jgi:hypothetical protein
MGYDSLSTWHQLGRPAAVHFDLGVAYTDAERSRYERARRSNPQLLPVQDLSWLGSRERNDAWIPLRNLLMCVHTAALGFDDIVLAAPSDWATDKRLLFSWSASFAMRVADPGARYRVRRPFSGWTKARLIAATPPELLQSFAYSCYRGAEPPCGKCSACGRAVVAHLAAGREPPTPVPSDLTFRQLMGLRRGEPGDSHPSEAIRIHPGELSYLPARGVELLRAWRVYRARP